MNAATYKPVHGGRPEPLGDMPADGSACGSAGCILPVGHGGNWHDDGRACWPILDPGSLAQGRACSTGRP